MKGTPAVRRTPVILLALAVAGGVAAALPVGSAAAETPATIPQSHPLWATPSAKVSDVAASTRVTIRVYLKTRDAAAAEAAAQAVSDPRSPQFRQYLSTGDVKARFAPTDAQVGSVRSWLSGAGFALGSVPVNNAFVEATGSADAVNRTFNVHLGEYKVKGQTLRAADTDLHVPDALAATVLGVIGADQAESLIHPNHIGGSDTTTDTSNKAGGKPGVVPPPTGFRNSQPCSAYFGQKVDTTDPAYSGQQLPYAPCGYTPAQLRAAYGIADAVNAGIDGHGTTVAIVDAFASPTLYSDAATYASRNDPSHPLRASQFREIVYPPTPGSEGADQCGAAGWYGEQSLDVEAVHAMAPAAKILFVGGADCQDLSLDKALNEIVSKGSANMVSNSYGNAGEDLPATDVAAFHQIAVQAAMEGIGLYFSSGDSGDEAANLGQPEPDFSASDPWVTAVGGTSLGIDANGNKTVETGWETGKSVLTKGVWGPTNYLYGSGGGTSRLFPEPFYQKGTVPDALAAQNQTGTNRGRVVPDVSMLGDPNTGFLIGLTQTFPDGVYYDQYRIGGTSLASPLMAGFVADADQFTGIRHGFINPWLYLVTSHTPAIKDVKAATGGVIRVDYVDGTDPAAGLRTSARQFNSPDQTIHTTNGYDNVTGVGTPSGWWFLFLS
jgi:subtilase family serine protease